MVVIGRRRDDKLKSLLHRSGTMLDWEDLWWINARMQWRSIIINGYVMIDMKC